MNRAILFVFACVCFSCGSNQTSMRSENNSAAANDAGWTTLFDGKTTKGWHSYGKDHVAASWKVENGTLHLDAADKKNSNLEGGDMVTNDEYENFDLKIEWKISEKGNSGIIFYVHEDPA